MKTRLIVVILSLLGLAVASGCDNGDPSVEYGTPYAIFTVKGKVTDAEGNAVPRIRITGDAPFDYSDETWTTNDGDFILETRDGWSQIPCVTTLHFSDIDYALHGEFADKDVVVTFEEVDEVENTTGHWCEGMYEKTMDVTLSSKTAATEQSKQE